MHINKSRAINAATVQTWLKPFPIKRTVHTAPLSFRLRLLQLLLLLSSGLNYIPQLPCFMHLLVLSFYQWIRFLLLSVFSGFLLAAPPCGPSVSLSASQSATAWQGKARSLEPERAVGARGRAGRGRGDAPLSYDCFLSFLLITIFNIHVVYQNTSMFMYVP